MSMFRKVLSYQHTPILALLVLCLAVGIFTVEKYGESWDEAEIFGYADYSIQAYQYILHPRDLQPYSRDLNYYGPAYFMIAATVSNFFSLVDPSLSTVTARHFVYFLTSLACMLVLYLLAKRWMSSWAAFGATLLFASQPLIWGHSFINPKDIPFMTFFLASVYLGFQMMDAVPQSKWRWLIPAGIVLGLTISMRVIGPLAAILVVIYGSLRSPRKIITSIPFYFLIAGITTYLTWPFLWKAPITDFIESLKLMSRFPYAGLVLYMGKLYPANQLPRGYFPTLLALQLTEPALVLMAVGFMVSLWSFIKGRDREPLLLFAVWFLAPTLWIVLSRGALYDNARQLLFLWPPLFILAGMGIERLLTVVRLPVFRSALLLIAALPGIYACIHLYPYEYIYYNSLAGGVKGAYRNFELDYWATSFRESMQYLDQNAEQGATVLVNGTRQVARQYARPDLAITVLNKANMSKSESYYILSSTRGNQDLTFCSDSGMAAAVERDGGVLSYVKKINSGQDCR